MRSSILTIMPFWKRLFAKKRLYADAAASTPLSPAARKELLRLLPLFGNPGALHREALQAKEELEGARRRIAGAIGAHADEIVFTASGTEANNLAIQGVLRPLLLKHGTVHAVTTSIEHQSVLEPLRALERERLSVTRLPAGPDGLVDPKALREAITGKTVFVSIQMVNPEMGALQPLREIAKEIRHVLKIRKGNPASLPLYFHTDSCQGPLWLPFVVEKLGIDLATLDGQKVLGPKGVGALYIKRGVPVEPVLWGGKQERSLRGGTENTPLCGSFAVALAHAQEGVEERSERIAAVRDTLMGEIQKQIPDAVIHGPLGEHRVANNINVSIPGLTGEMATIALDSVGIAVSTRSACTIGDEEPSHVIRALGVPRELAQGAIRITLLPDATVQDARHIARELKAVAAQYRVQKLAASF